MEQTYKVGRYLFGVRTNSKRFANWLEKTLAAYQSPKKISPMYSLAVGKPKKGGAKPFNLLYRESLILSRTLDLEEAVRGLLNEMESLAFAEWDEGLYIEAAPASINGTTALLPNLAAVRLSEATRQMKRRGLSVPPSGRVAVDAATGDLMPIPPLFTIPDDRFAALARLAPQNGTARRAKKPATDLPEIAMVLIPAPAPWDEDTPDPVRDLTPAVALQKFVEEQVVNLGVMGGAALEGMARLIDGAKCYEILHQDAQTLLDGVVAAMTGTEAPTLKKPERPEMPQGAMINANMEAPVEESPKPRATRKPRAQAKAKPKAKA